MPILGTEHDLAHPVEPDEAWSESYYFNAYDPVSDTGIFTRIGIRPNEGTMDVGLSCWLPGQQLAEYRSVREQHEMVDQILEVGGVCYEMLQAMRQWRLTADCEAEVRDLVSGEHRPVPIGLDVTFASLIPAVGVDAQGRRSEGASAQTSSSVGKGHLEQAGRWTGVLEAEGLRHVWGEARGNRDKSWGPRRWGGPRMWRWFSINLGDDVHFGGIRIGTGAGDLHRGWVWKDGEHASVREWRVKTELADDDLTHRVSHVTAVDKRDRVHDLRGEVLKVANIGYRSGTVVNEGLTRWEHEGLTGHGVAEYLHQLDDDGHPLVPVE